jgi:hypothetical protein
VGERFTVTVAPSHPSSVAAGSRSFTVAPGAAEVTVRRLLIQTILQVLKSHLAGTSHESAFELHLQLVTYTFGSIHNTIVNSRFARADLDEE